MNTCNFCDKELNNLNKFCSRTCSNLSRTFKLTFDEIRSLTPFIDGGVETSKERMFYVRNNLTEKMDFKCEFCLKDINFGKRFCSESCSNAGKISNGLNFEQICALTPFIDGSRESLNRRMFCLNNSFTEVPKCPVCGKDTKWQEGRDNFSTFCSMICSKKNVSKETKNKMRLSKSNFYAKFGTDGKGYIYVLHFKGRKAVKIGISRNLKERKKTLKRIFGEFEEIIIMESNNCRSVEHRVHEFFEKSRLIQPEKNGGTEFFKEEILNDVLDYLLSFKTSSML